jgi:hypothetical protein
LTQYKRTDFVKASLLIKEIKKKFDKDKKIFFNNKVPTNIYLIINLKEISTLIISLIEKALKNSLDHQVRINIKHKNEFTQIEINCPYIHLKSYLTILNNNECLVIETPMSQPQKTCKILLPAAFV